MQRVLNLYQGLRPGEKVLVLVAVVLLLLALVSTQVEPENAEANSSAISAFAAVVAASAAWWAIYAQNTRARLTLSVNLTQQFSDKWDSADMKETRKNAAAYILRETTAQLTLTALRTPTETDREDREDHRDAMSPANHDPS